MFHSRSNDELANPTRLSWRCQFALACIYLAGALYLLPQSLHAQREKIVWSGQEKPIVQQIHGLRSLPDEIRARTTKDLALQIRQLPATPNQLRLANALADLSTEGDFGHDTLQEVATTLADALQKQPAPDEHGRPAAPYLELAQLVRYEHVQTSLEAPQLAAAMAKLKADDEKRQQADFSLKDLQGKEWTLKSLRGKVVLVNFWATWCPPCRKEMPDLDALYRRFQNDGFVVLAISDEDEPKVKQFLAARDITYPILLDPGRKVNELFQVDGIPKSFVYDREGKLVTESIDMRTQRQFLEMLEQAGLK
ncbi:MAG TPA: TlpA disulfide reductase family protein [Terriglobales bacterium]|nr:TlpA disulfide reductase family protein [Terriglobales bacterium]